MKVKDLIKMLLEVANDDTIVHLASDEEGNSYADVSNSPMLIKLKETGENVVVLFPENYLEDNIYKYEKTN